jgi:hypothetical protein
MKYLVLVILISLSGCCYTTGRNCTKNCTPPGATRCQGSTIQLCSGGKVWVSKTKCPTGSKCDSEGGICACVK